MGVGPDHARIPAGTVPADAGPIKLVASAPHMHEIGTSLRTVVERASASEENACLIDIDRWDFEWQGGYRYKEPLQLYPGDQIKTTCNYFNSTGSQVGFGEGTGDEMCFNFLFVVDNGALPQLCFSPCTYLPCEDLL